MLQARDENLEPVTMVSRSECVPDEGDFTYRNREPKDGDSSEYTQVRGQDTNPSGKEKERYMLPVRMVLPSS